jgi:hypothetical protein
MLLHTRGILVMTPDSAVVLTGKQALDYSGGVSAEDNFGIGGYDRIMGPNGQARYWATDLVAACEILFAHYGYHGGAFVVFSGTLSDNMEVIAVEGSYASVIGGAPAAATVFARDVNTRTDTDPRVVRSEARLDGAEGDERASLRVALADLRASVRSDKLGEVAAEFDRVHTVERALRVGSIDAIIPAARLRPHLVEALERGNATNAGATTTGGGSWLTCARRNQSSKERRRPPTRLARRQARQRRRRVHWSTLTLTRRCSGGHWRGRRRARHGALQQWPRLASTAPSR